MTSEERMLVINRLHELLRPFMLRRVKTEVMGQLPEKVRHVGVCSACLRCGKIFLFTLMYFNYPCMVLYCFFIRTPLPLPRKPDM